MTHPAPLRARGVLVIGPKRDYRDFHNPALSGGRDRCLALRMRPLI
jgi:hypothetical protein